MSCKQVDGQSNSTSSRSFCFRVVLTIISKLSNPDSLDFFNQLKSFVQSLSNKIYCFVSQNHLSSHGYLYSLPTYSYNTGYKFNLTSDKVGKVYLAYVLLFTFPFSLSFFLFSFTCFLFHFITFEIKLNIKIK